MNKIILTLCFFLLAGNTFSKTITIGESADYTTLQLAAEHAQPGDTLLLLAETHSGDNHISDLKGTKELPIVILGEEGSEKAVFLGGSNAFQLSNPAHLIIKNLQFSEQTINSVNIDDGGDYSTPAVYIIIEDCEWLDINATGNNDQLKLSGLNYFVIRNCRFTWGSPGGSMIDMVGCHQGVIEDCQFIHAGSNSIQAKGGSSSLVYHRNYFGDGGQRALNIGGSTGLEYFRPLGAKYEATKIAVYSNVFVGGVAAFAFVGATECTVANNTIFTPEKWTFRILQENTTEGMLACGDNAVINNIFYIYDEAAVYTVNIGPNVDESAFIYSHNLWFNYDDLNWGGPNIPWDQENGIIGKDPQFRSHDNLRIEETSPAIGKGMPLSWVDLDYDGNIFKDPPSIGAYEGDLSTSVISFGNNFDYTIFPNPASNHFSIKSESGFRGMIDIELFSLNGEKVGSFNSVQASNSIIELNIEDLNLSSGAYILSVIENGIRQQAIVFIR
jgi:type IX secretion system substrate protein/parallel beta helix pectate lyase-like protein